MTFRQVIAGIVAGVTVGVLCACAPVDATPAAIPTPSPSVTPDATPPVEPVSAFGVSCAELADDSVVTAAVGSVGEAIPVLPEASTYGLHQAAMLQDGALLCQWGSIFSGNLVTVQALPDAAAFYARARPGFETADYPYTTSYTPVDKFDGALVECVENSAEIPYACTWQVLSGDVWLSIGIFGVPATDLVVPSPREAPDGSLKPLIPVIDGSAGLALVSAIVDSIGGAPRVAVSRNAVDLASCTRLLDSSEIESAIGTEISPVTESAPPEDRISRSSASFGVSMYAYSMERLGFGRCTGAESTDSIGWSVQISMAKDIDWLFETPYPAAGWNFETVDGVGDVYSACFADEGGEGCNVIVIGGEIVVAVLLFDSQNVAIATAFAASVLAHAAP